MIDLVGHALLNSTVGLNVNDVTDPILPKIRGERNEALLAEVSRKGISSARAKTV